MAPSVLQESPWELPEEDKSVDQIPQDCVYKYATDHFLSAQTIKHVLIHR